jgi:hypothetical protein
MNAWRARRIRPYFAPVIVAVFGGLVAVSCSRILEPLEPGAHSQGQAVKVSFWTESAQPRANQNVTFHARIAGIPAQQVKDARVDFAYYVFADYKPQGFVTDLPAQPTGSDEYMATGRFNKATDWKVAVRIRRPGVEPVTSFFTVTVRPAPK